MRRRLVSHRLLVVPFLVLSVAGCSCPVACTAAESCIDVAGTYQLTRSSSDEGACTVRGPLPIGPATVTQTGPSLDLRVGELAFSGTLFENNEFALSGPKDLPVDHQGHTHLVSENLSGTFSGSKIGPGSRTAPAAVSGLKVEYTDKFPDVGDSYTCAFKAGLQGSSRTP